MSQDCAFCDTSIEVSTFAQTSDIRAAYNIAPIVPGHIMIIPKRHEQRIQGLSEDEFIHFWSFARQVTDFMLEVFETEAFDWTVQQMPEAGQTVPHLHLHVIPRVADDFPNPGDWYPKLRESKIVDHAREVIDSDERVRLSLDERAAIASELSAKWEVFTSR